MFSQRKILFQNKIDMNQLEDCKNLAAELFNKLDSSSVILLSGDMGAGKTQWTKFYLQNFGYTDVESPTFSLHNIYETKSGKVHHFDLHRIESDEELDQIGLWEILSEPESAIIEWPDRIKENDIPKSKKVLKINIDKSRKVELCYYAAEE